MAQFRSESNVFCDSVGVEIAAGATSPAIRPSRNLTAPVGPRKVSSVCVKFDASTSGSVDITVSKGGIEFQALSQSVSNASSVVVSGIGLWLVGRDFVKVANNTQQKASAIVDFEY